MQARQSKDMSMLVQFELKQNATVGVLFEEYLKLTDTEKALFRLALDMSQDAINNTPRVTTPQANTSAYPGRADNKPASDKNLRCKAEANTAISARPDENTVGELPYPSYGC